MTTSDYLPRSFARNLFGPGNEHYLQLAVDEIGGVIIDPGRFPDALEIVYEGETTILEKAVEIHNRLYPGSRLIKRVNDSNPRNVTFTKL